MTECKLAVFCCDIDAGGGVESVSKRLDTELNKQGIHSKIYSLKTASSYSNAFAFNFGSEKLSEADIETIRTVLRTDGISHVVMQLNSPFAVCLLADIRLYKKLADSFKLYTILHSSPLSFLSRYRVFSDNAFIFMLKWLKTKLLYAPLAKKFVRQCRNYSTLVSISNGNKNELKRFYEVDSVLIPNCFNLTVSDESVVADKEHIIAYLGRIDYEAKNFKLLLDAWRNVRNKGDWLLKIVGNGDKSALEQYAQKHKIQQIQFCNGIPLDAVGEFFKSIGIFILTSYHEGFPTVLLEAASFGNALISTKFDGFSDEIVKNERNGYATDFSAKNLSSKIQNLIDDEIVLKSMQKQSLQITQEYLDEFNVIDRWKAIL